METKRTVKMYLPASTAAMNSASVELSAIVSWNRDLYRIAPPAILITIPVTDLRCLESPAQSESLVHNNVFMEMRCRVAIDFSS